jgi:hypothetical protein
VYAQQAAPPSDQDQAVIEQFTQELLTNIATENGKQDAKVKLLSSAEKEAEKDWKRIAAAREKAARESAMADQYAVLMRSRIRKHGGAQSIDTNAYEDYEKSIQEAAAAKSSLAELTTQEDAAKKNLDTTRRDLESARNVRDARVAASEQQRTELTKLYTAWKENKTEDNFKALTGQLTMMAAAAGETSDVDLVTKKDNNPNPGALIKYESDLDRKNKAQPIKSANCATGCTEKGMPKGWYYMWSERDQKETSDKNRYVHIKGPTDTVEIIENH